MTTRLPAWRRGHLRQANQISRLGDRLQEVSRSQSLIRRSASYELMRPGSQWLAVVGAPPSDLGLLNDWAFDVDSGDAYLKTSDAVWTFQRNLTGPAGATQDLTPYALKTEVPSLEEIATQATLLWGGTATTTTTVAGSSQPLLIATFPLRILSLHLSFAAAVTASTVNFWNFTLKKSATGPGAAVDIVSRDTQTAGLGNRTSFNFDAQTWNATNRLLSTGDVAWLATTLTGAPTQLSGGIVTIRYARQ